MKYKMRDNLRIREQSDGYAVFDVFNARFFHINATCNEILQYCCALRDEDEIVNYVLNHFVDCPSEEVVREDIRMILNELLNMGLVEAL